MRNLLIVALLSLGACAQVAGGVSSAKSFVYAKGAKMGNNYCVVRDPALAEGFNTRMNAGLRDEGAEFDLDITVKCD